MTRRKGAPPIETKSPGPRKRKPIPLAHIDTAVHVPLSLLSPLKTLQRCIMTADGVMANNRQWLEIERKDTRLGATGPWASARITTADGREWVVTAQEANK